MRRTTPVTAATIIAAATLTPVALPAIAETVTTPAVASAADCPDQMTFAVGGVGDGASQHVPGVTGPVTRIHYSASIAPVGPVSGNDSRADGVRKLDQAARAFRAECPNSKIIIQGNSLGAMVVGDVRDQWSDDPLMSHNTKAVLISDPRAPRGAAAMLPDFIPGFDMYGPRPPSPIPTARTCRVSDAICDLGSVFEDPGHALNASIGYLTGEHIYQDQEVRKAPGVSKIEGKHIVPDTPLPIEAPSPRQVFQPLSEAVVPDAPIIVDHYEPTPVENYLPPVIEPYVPEQVKQFVPPPLPPLPPLPRLPW